MNYDSRNILAKYGNLLSFPRRRESSIKIASAKGGFLFTFADMTLMDFYNDLNTRVAGVSPALKHHT